MIVCTSCIYVKKDSGSFCCFFPSFCQTVREMVNNSEPRAFSVSNAKYLLTQCPCRFSLSVKPSPWTHAHIQAQHTPYISHRVRWDLTTPACLLNSCFVHMSARICFSAKGGTCRRSLLKIGSDVLVVTWFIKMFYAQFICVGINHLVVLNIPVFTYFWSKSQTKDCLWTSLLKSSTVVHNTSKTFYLHILCFFIVAINHYY